MSMQREITSLTIKPVTGAESALLAAMLRTFNGVETSPAQVRERLRRSQGVEHPVLAYLGDVAVGFASLRLHFYLGEDAPYAELSELFVYPNYRRQGVARALIEALAAKAQAAGATSMTVLTDEENAAALRTYKALGFTPFSVALQQWFTDERPYRIAEEE